VTPIRRSPANSVTNLLGCLAPGLRVDQPQGTPKGVEKGAVTEAAGDAALASGWDSPEPAPAPTASHMQAMMMKRPLLTVAFMSRLRVGLPGRQTVPEHAFADLSATRLDRSAPSDYYCVNIAMRTAR
jgi:hypothetical protein